jgi:hypothetical protein
MNTRYATRYGNKEAGELATSIATLSEIVQTSSSNTQYGTTMLNLLAPTFDNINDVLPIKILQNY